MRTELIQKIAVTFEICGTTLSAPAKAQVVDDLEKYPEETLSVALDKCRNEVKGRLAPKDIHDRIQSMDGRPGADEAWALMPRSEDDSVCWTEEMSAAFDEVRTMTDMVAARRSFIDKYTRIIEEARRTGRPVKWSVSLGHDPIGREGCVRVALERGLIDGQTAETLCPGVTAPALPAHESKRELPPMEITKPGPTEVREHLEGLVGYRPAGGEG